MNPKPLFSRILLYFVGIILCGLLTSCQAGSTTPAQSAPAVHSTEQQSASQPAAAGTLNLPDPLIGAANLTSYQLTYANTVKGTLTGQAADMSLSIAKLVNGADSSEVVRQTSSGGQPLYLAVVTLNGGKYTQQTEGKSCQIKVDETAAPSPAAKLPPVFGAKLIGQDTVNAVASQHYQFDEKAVQRQAGRSGKAQGELWLASSGGYLVKYALTIQYSTGDFQGTRSWMYELSGVENARPVSLPEGCQALLTDLPLMQGAVDVVQLPGFQKYSVPSALAPVAQFYTEQLTAAGWTILPGVEAEGGAQSLTAVLNPPDGGGRFAVIQLREQGGQTAVVVQSAATKKPIVLDVSPETVSVTPTEEVEETDEAQASLPADLPQYPGAAVLVQQPQVLILKTADVQSKVEAFYNQAMPAAGYSLENKLETNGIITQMWVRDTLRIILVIMPQSGGTQITISAENQ